MSDPFSGRRHIKEVEVYDSPFADRCRKARKRSGLTQVEAAKAIGVNRTTITNIECGSQAPSIRAFVRICEVYKVSADYMLYKAGIEYGEGS